MHRVGWLLPLVFGLFAACWGDTASAHPPVNAGAAIRVTAEHELTIFLTHDALAFALNDASRNVPDEAMFALLAAPDEALTQSLDEARDRFTTLCTLLVDGVPVLLTVTAAPTAAQVRDWQGRHRSYPLPIKLEIVARAAVPADARAFRIRFPDMLGDLILSVEQPGREAIVLPLGPGEVSPEFSLLADPAVASVSTPPGVQAPSLPSPHGTRALLKRFSTLGFTHIIPHGPDHALFVLGLFLLSPRLKAVLYQITAFTIAHTVTLTLTTLGIIGLPGVLVETTIAASVAFIGIENLLTTRVHPWRPAVAFLFGLVHGMGVATAFAQAGFPAGQLVSSLAAFTVGVEGGHLAALAAAFAVLGWFNGRVWFRSRVTIPLSLAIAMIALVWMVQRLLAA